MKENSSTRLKHSIQKKLMAATSMLMVAVIMMVSSTYAWFTLSTAPEVTGITTAVGANGNLEIALAYVDASKNINTWENPEQISSAVGTSGDNTSWGNLIDVEDNTIYGLDKITLLPAELNVTKTDEMAMVNTSSYLSTPVYGADGRVSALSPNSAVTGVYNSTEKAFYVNDAMKGVRAIGTASAMTERQTDYRNAKASLTSNGTLAQISASNSLYNNGSDLANIILKHATANANTEKYSAEEVATVQNVITSLNTAVQKIGIALEDAMKGYVASAAVQNAATGAIDDATYENIKGSLTLANVQGTTGEGGVVTAPYTITVNSTSYTLPATWSTAYEIYTGSVADLASAQTAVNACPTDGEATWAQISEALRYLVDTNKVNVNGYTADQVKDNMSALVNAVASGGVKVQLPNNSGVYSDIAALTGDYTTSITIKEVTYNNLTLENLNATMSTVVIGNGTDQVSTPYFTVLSTEIGAAGAPAAGAADADTKITDFYGYAIDMLFRTNASSSNLLLQTSAVDRIYSDNKANEETMGGGSTMTFKTLDAATFSTDQVAKLMNAIRVVFMDDTGKILANARLDMGETTANGATTKNYVITGESVTADLLIWNEETTTVEGEENTVVKSDATKEEVEGETYKDTETTDSTTGVVTKVDYTSTLNEDGSTYTITSTTTKTTPGSFQEKNKGVITALNQNEATQVTALVYLDGNYVDNTMVAATTTQSMTGTMNLQFASSATLVPMSNTALEQGNASMNTSESGSTTTP